MTVTKPCYLLRTVLLAAATLLLIDHLRLTPHALVSAYACGGTGLLLMAAGFTAGIVGSYILFLKIIR